MVAVTLLELQCFIIVIIIFYFLFFLAHMNCIFESFSMLMHKGGAKWLRFTPKGSALSDLFHIHENWLAH